MISQPARISALLALGLAATVANSGTRGLNCLAADVPSTVTTFRVFEISLTAQQTYSHPKYVKGPVVTASFNGPGGARLDNVKGFWDGGNTWKIRFAPTVAGAWSYSTACSETNDAGLHGKTGRLKAVPATAAQRAENPLYRGFLARDGDAWQLSDGTPFLPIGDTQFSFSEEFSLDEFQQWMDALAERGLNTLHGCIWLAKYPRGGLTAFADGEPRTERLTVEYFRRLDQEIQYANDCGIMVGLVIGGFPQDSFNETGWWRHFETREREERWWRYCIARYASYNVRWLLYGEVNEIPVTPWGSTWREEVARKARLVRDEDPYDHPIGSHHNRVDTSSAANPDIDYIEVQIRRTELQWTDALAARQYGKPVWFEEYWYESEQGTKQARDTVDRGIRNTHRNFVAALAYPTFGSAMRAHSKEEAFPPTVAAKLGLPLKEYLLKHDPGLAMMGHFAKFHRGLDTRKFSFACDLVNHGQCGRFGDDYVIFLEGGGTVVVNWLLGERGTAFDVTRMEIATGVAESLGPLVAKGFTRIDSRTTADVVLLLKRAAK